MPIDTHTQQDTLACIDALHRQAIASYQRLGIVLAGSAAWTQRISRLICDRLDSPRSIMLSTRPDATDVTPLTRADRYLGEEFDLMLLDMQAGCDANLLAASAGSVRGGGVLILCLPPLTDTQTGQPDSRFMQRLQHSIRQHRGILLISEQQGVHSPLPAFAAQPLPAVAPPCRTLDQQGAVAAILHLAHGHPHRPLVITSDRGRGKSTAMGIAAAQLLRQARPLHIIVTAPRFEACRILFTHVARLLDLEPARRRSIRYQQSVIEFVAPDALLEQRPAADVVLVDEAAAIPLPMLQTLLTHYPRLVFASTTYGYEGTGRGFALRFNRILDSQTPGWQALELTTPVRWAGNDPLEQFLFDALLLNAPLTMASGDDSPRLAPARVRRVDQDQLVEDAALLEAVFALLVLAHYRTKPGDLQQLLDDPNLRIYSLSDQTRIIATAIISLEGGFDTQLAKAIYLGQRRPKGHLLAQTLAFHVGIPDAAGCHYARIMRIAVHPAWQQQGFGSKLLSGIVQDMQQQGVDAIGASFGATEPLLRFWERAGYQPVRIGLTREHSSGAHAVVMLQALTTQGNRILGQARQRFAMQLPGLLAEPLKDLEPALSLHLLAGIDQPPAEALSEYAQQDLHSYIDGLRGYELCMPAITQLVTTAIGNASIRQHLSPAQQQLLTLRVIHRHSWSDVIQELQLPGKKAAFQLMREAVSALHSLLQTRHIT